ncbi:hypothetical protein AZE42_09476 [Rhizopogon vesiculosus]|uniref:Uncharacterized protein n=1 Tax=Rhizopogon vesiculosus TaxID=180088 RepID=A0A1J8PZE5_9AGAM|nr:hypothetical protein AZE42_09476 [Rhizopogon vesiculosus]
MKKSRQQSCLASSATYTHLAVSPFRC